MTLTFTLVPHKYLWHMKALLLTIQKLCANIEVFVEKQGINYMPQSIDEGA